MNVVFNAIFYRFGVWGIPLATTLVNVAAAAALLVMMRRRVGLTSFRRTSAVVARIAAAAAVAAAAAFLTWYGLDQALGRTVGAQLVSLGAALAVAGLVYAGAAKVLGVRELEALLLLRGRRDES